MRAISSKISSLPNNDRRTRATILDKDVDLIFDHFHPDSYESNRHELASVVRQIQDDLLSSNSIRHDSQTGRAFDLNLDVLPSIVQDSSYSVQHILLEVGRRKLHMEFVTRYFVHIKHISQQIVHVL